ncbi:MAG: FAD-dependent oxidoreductase, partial [Spirochaetia bacterium]|nr:FAD-dependent oxidoreductase [Spirochaetia bacterium]
LEHPSYTTADEVDKKVALLSMLNHPISYIKFLSYLNISAKNLLEKYFTDPRLFNFFDKLTSTYCYTTVEESPAILASIMFVDNHVGGSYYVAGSTLFLPGKLEKVIEEHGSEIINSATVVSILFENYKPCGVLFADGRSLYADNLIYSGTVWNLYGALLPFEHTTEKKRAWAQNQEPTYPSVVLYAVVDQSVIDERSLAVEMLVGRIDAIDEEEVTVYIPSIDDRTLCASDEHIVIAIGPSFGSWKDLTEIAYQKQKDEEKERLLKILEKRWHSLKNHIRYAEVATPRTIERFTLKNNGAVAGPKQMLGSHMFKRLRTRTEWDTLFCCGESTVMGTGTPTVTTSGIAAANAILKKLNLPLFVYEKKQKQYVHLIKPPFTEEQLYVSEDEKRNEIQKAARRCLLCEHPSCAKIDELDVRGIMRRVTVGNFLGAKRRLECFGYTDFSRCETHCIREEAVAIKDVCSYLQTTSF